MGRRLLAILLFITILILTLSSTVFAGREWAPGIKGKSGSSKEAGTSNMWLRLGLHGGQLWNDTSDYDAIRIGLGMEAGIRPIAAKPDAPVRWSVELPFVLTTTMHEIDFDGFMFVGQIIPTARVTFGQGDGTKISPCIGYGGGLALFVSSPINESTNQVWSFRLGADVMFSKTFGIFLNYTRTSFDSSVRVSVSDPMTFGWTYIDEPFVFRQGTLGIVYHP